MTESSPPLPDSPPIFLAIPAYAGNVKPQFMARLLGLIGNCPDRFRVHFCNNDSLVSRARNTLAADFLETDCERLIFLDTDLVFDPQALYDFSRRPEPIVAGIYPKKTDTFSPVWNLLPGVHTLDAGLIEVAEIGTGLLSIHRRVFEHLAEGGYVQSYDRDIFDPSGEEQPRQEHDYFPVGVWTFPGGKRRYLSEDWYFCQLARKAGYRIFADTTLRADHIGEKTYPHGGWPPVKDWFGPRSKVTEIGENRGSGEAETRGSGEAENRGAAA